MDEETQIKEIPEENNPINDNYKEKSMIVEDDAPHVKIDSDKSDVLYKRKEKILSVLKKEYVIVVGILIIALILGVYIRSLPMQDHGGNPGLWNIATDSWTLGPDLDPWLFTRYAKILVEQGALPEIDTMRFVPLGFDTSVELTLLSRMISYVYYILHFFDESVTVEYAAVIFPVIMFAFTLISFFLFVREIFSKKSKKSKLDASIIALISTFFLIVIPAFLSRTIAGIPEKESAGFFFMFLAFYLFLKAWKSYKTKNYISLAILSGIVTGLMGLIWGGVFYVYISIAGSILISFILNKIDKKEFSIYSIWLIVSITFLLTFSNRFNLGGMVTSLAFGLAFLTFFVLLVNIIISKTRLSKIKFIEEAKLPKNIVSLIIAIILMVILSSILIGPTFIIEKIKVIHQTIFQPVSGRWNTTVAENRQPYFTEWRQSFGPFINNIPVLFWMFFIGSAVLFKKTLNKIKQKDAWVLTLFYIFFFFGIVFSRYAAPPHIMNGAGFVSKFFYYASALIFFGFLVYYYLKYSKEGHNGFKKINYGYILLFTLFFLCLFTARGAIRTVIVLAPITLIFLGFLIVESINKFRATKDETWKIVFGCIVIIILLLSFFIFYGNPISKSPGFYQTTKAQAYSFIPSSYTQQWQKAMKWVDEETPKDSVFSHWWDYGYWVQSIGNRATVLDGGNSITYWNYLMGRLVLTGNNQDDALEFLYNHNATHLLIDSTDIGKYGAYSSIGSDKDYDRYSWMTAFVLDDKQTQETQNQTILIYPGGILLDEDLIFEENGVEILLPKQNTGVGALFLPIENIDNVSNYKQPYAIFVYQGKQYKINLRYLSISGRQFMDFESGIESTLYIFPRLFVSGTGASMNPLGASLFISPRNMRGMMAQTFILNDPLNNFPNFNLIHTENSLIVDNLISQGMDLPEFVYYQGIRGPIKIWDITYTGKEKIKEEYLDTNYKNYLDWKL